MSGQARMTLSWPVLITGAVFLLVLGSGMTYIALRSMNAPMEPARTMGGENPASPGAKMPGTDATTSEAGSVAEVTVTLSEEAVKRAGIATAPVGAGESSSALRAPGTVQPNAYQQVVVTPLVSGRIMRVSAELGQVVQPGQTLAEVFSPELAEAQARYVAARAELAAHEQELARTEKLAGIGAASRQELERIHAEHTARRSGVESAAARLRLLGLSAKAIEALAPGTENAANVDVPAPIAGVVTARTANVGANVDSTTPLFTITDLSTVWVVVDLYEKDFSRVRIGSMATIATRAYPDLRLAGRVSYIDPQVNPDTRTAKARIQVTNPRRELRLGMFAEAVFDEAASKGPIIPRAAVQNVGNRTVVYLVDSRQPGRFIERQVQLGAATGENLSVVSGVEVGDIVVTQGSFAVRAERERLGMGASSHQMR